MSGDGQGRGGCVRCFIGQFEVCSLENSAVLQKLVEPEEERNFLGAGGTIGGDPEGNFQKSVPELKVIQIGADVELAWLGALALDEDMGLGEQLGAALGKVRETAER